MRLYHTILILSGIFLALNAGFQAAWLRQFSLVRESVEEFDRSWLPAVRACGELTRLVSEFRRYELRYAIAESEREMASLARSLGRQTDRIRQAEERLAGLLGSQAEKEAFTAYLARKREYMTNYREALISMMDAPGKAHALSVVRSSGAVFTAMTHDILAVEAAVHELGEKAGREADWRYLRVRLNMLVAGVAVLAVGVAAAVLAARRLSRPLWELARFMAGHKEPGEEDLPDAPSWATMEVSMLYRSFRALSTRLARTMKRLEALSVTDQLTGTANRRRLMEQGARILDICRRGGTPCAALMLDLDHFKAVNDTHGHAAGDTVLREVAAALSSVVRSSDLLARYGGEEFALVAPNSGLEEALHLAERLRAGVEARVIATPGGELRVTVSVGVAVASEGDGLEQLLDKADHALYRAKQNGRNRVERA